MNKFLRTHSSQITATVSATVSVVLAVLSNSLYENIKIFVQRAGTPKPWVVIMGIVFIVVTILLFFAISCIAEHIKKMAFPEIMDDCYMREAFLHLRELGANRQRLFQESRSFEKPTDESIVQESASNIQLAVESCYLFFDEAFSTTGELVNDIKFEVTFMTRSYIDGAITIPCSANKERRTPNSMLLRKDDIQIFDNTETAKIYAMKRPKMILVSNTADKAANYAETYAKQKDRIRSTVVLPVLSHKSELLGTLVVHCDRAGFFEKKRYCFWKELLEIFSVEIGYHKLMLDYYIENDSDLPKPF